VTGPGGGEQGGEGLEEEEREEEEEEEGLIAKRIEWTTRARERDTETQRLASVPNPCSRIIQNGITQNGAWHPTMAACYTALNIATRSALRG
jgi:hypothetical protein